MALDIGIEDPYPLLSLQMSTPSNSTCRVSQTDSSYDKGKKNQENIQPLTDTDGTKFDTARSAQWTVLIYWKRRKSLSSQNLFQEFAGPFKKLCTL